MSVTNNARYLLALHSSTKKLGVAVLDLTDESNAIKSSVFDADKQLSNNLFKYVDSLLAKKNWSKIARLAVATGPGGFTGTRLTIVMARTLAQQINCQLDGISSFSLMAPRLYKSLKPTERMNPFWIVESLQRRGIIGGQYQIVESQEKTKIQTIEIQKPLLLKNPQKLKPALNAIDDVSQDIKQLIKNCLDSFKEKKISRWQKIIPIYPTSPVDKF